MPFILNIRFCCFMVSNSKIIAKYGKLMKFLFK